MTLLGCKWHPSADNVGVCAHCLRESLSRLAVYQGEEDDSIDLEIFPPSMPSSGMPAGSRRAQFILVQYDEDGNNDNRPTDNSDLFYPGVNRNALGALVNQQQPYIHEPTDLNLDGPDMQGDVSTSEDSGSGGQDEGAAHHVPPRVEESNRNKRKLHSSSGRRKPKSWGSAMMKMVGFRTLSVLWRSEKNKTEASSSRTKPHDHGFEGSVDSGVPAHDNQFTPARFSVSSALEQTTPHRYSVSSQWEQTTPTRYNDQVTPARYSGASLFDIESMDSRRFSTSSRGSPFTAGRPVINNENFNAAWRASKSGAHGRKIGAYEESKVGIRDDGMGKSPVKSPMKSPWKWLASFKSVATTPKESLSSRQKAALEAVPPAPVSPYQERRKSTSSMPVNKSRENRPQQPLTPVLTSKKSPWWKSSPIPRTPKKSPVMLQAKSGNREQEVATDSQDDTPHRLSSASPMVGYSRSSSNGSSCFTTPRWNNNRTRPQHGSRGMAVHEREHEITHLAI